MVNYPYGHTNISISDIKLEHWGEGTFEVPKSKDLYFYDFKKNFIATTHIFVN
jgi:hypothetical protein